MEGLNMLFAREKFRAPAPSEGTALLVFDQMSPLDVVWDDESLHGLDWQDTLVQHEVVWDEEMPSDIGTHDSIVLTPVSTSGLPKQCINAAGQVFGDFSSKVVVWDEEKQHVFKHHGLLKQLAQGGNYFIGEEKLTAEPPTYDDLTHVSGSFCLLELGIEAVPEFDEIHLEDNHATMPEYVQFMDTVTSKGDAQEVCDGTRTEERVTSLAEEVTFFYTPKLSECAAVEVFNAVSLVDVIWDKEVHHNPNSHGLLPQLADDQEYLDVEVMMADLDSHDGFLQQLGGECWDDEKMICIPSSPGNKCSDPFSDFESVKLHMTAQIDSIEAILTEVDNMKHELGATNCQVSERQFSELVVLEKRQETIDDCKILTEMLCHGSTAQVIFDADYIANQCYISQEQVESKTTVTTRVGANLDMEKMSEVSECKKLQDTSLQLVAQHGECMGSKKTMMGCSHHPLSPGSAIRPTHQTFAHMTCQMTDYWVLNTMPHIDGVIADDNGEKKGWPLLQNGWIAIVIAKLFEEIHCQDVVWDGQLSWQCSIRSLRHLSIVNSCLVHEQLSGGFSPEHFQQLNIDERPRDPGIVMNNLHIFLVVLMMVQSPNVWDEEQTPDLSFGQPLLQQPAWAQECTDNMKTTLMLALFGGPLLFLENAVIHTDHLQGQPRNMWEISAACQMVMATMKWWHKHFSPWKSDSFWYCSEKMSLWNINVFNHGDGKQQQLSIATLALVSLLGFKRNKEFQDRPEQAGAQMLLYQFVGAKSKVLKISICNCTKLCLLLLGQEILETLISITSVMEKLRLTFPRDPGGHSSSYVHIQSYKRQLEGKLNLQGGIMSYTCPVIILPCGPAYHIHSFVLDCHVGPLGKRSYKRDQAVEEKH